MPVKKRLLELCQQAMTDKGLLDSRHAARLKEELRDIDAKNESEYFLDLYDREVRPEEGNENNLLVPFLLGLVDDFDIDRPPIYIYGELPDIDVDYLPEVRDYLKNEWAPSVFGRDCVCSIGSYNTFGVKGALLDMAKVHGCDRQEILKITTKLGTKDEDGNPLTWEAALSGNKELAKYCEEHPDVADAAHRLVGRIRSRGKHAGGLIISSVPIDKIVPLCVDSAGNPVSAWTEGLHSQDLQPVGLVKFDLLVITNLEQIKGCVMKLTGSTPVAESLQDINRTLKDPATSAIDVVDNATARLDKVCALPGRKNWSDVSYLNDPDAIVLANEAKLKCVFQFDSSGIRELVKQGGVHSFDDLVAYTALYRPGPLSSGMATNYCERKKGLEPYEIHPLLEDILGPTYGVLVYQEQVMKLLNVVGDVPLKDCEIVRKAISKKKVDKFIKYKEQFIEIGQQKLGWSRERLVELWDNIEAFAGYGFNLSHAVAYTYVSSRLLYLKAHHPLEFFAAILSCEQDEAKVKEYKLEASNFGIEVCQVDLNKSNVRFDINDGKIYAGLANIKGIGDEPAARIVAGQPYSSFEDFLSRFGTDANVLKPLVSLGVFCEPEERTAYWEFAEHYKDQMKKREARNKRNADTRKRYIEELMHLLPEDTEYKYDYEYNEKWWTELAEEDLDDSKFQRTFVGCEGEEQIPGLDVKEALKIYKKLKKNIFSHKKKVSEDEPITFADFRPTGKVDKKMKDILEVDMMKAEEDFYGFSWVNMLENSPDYDDDYTFSEFERRAELEDAAVRLVHCHVVGDRNEKPVLHKTSRNGNKYAVVVVEDGEGHEEAVTFWGEDYKRWQEELDFWEGPVRKGNLLELKLERPTPPFKNYTFDSPPRSERKKQLPENKEDDPRLTVMRRPAPMEAKQYAELPESIEI